MNPDGSAASYQWITYGEFYRRALAFGRGLLELGLVKGDKVGIYSANCRWWQLVANGAFSIGCTAVPVYDSLGKGAAEYIINHSEMKVVAVSEAKLRALLEVLPQTPAVAHVLVMSDIPPPDSRVRTCWSVQQLGEASTRENELAQPDDIAVLMYTSGSTGVPKGCLLAHSGIVAGAMGLSVVNTGLHTSDVFLSFLPLAHIYALAVELMIYSRGARVGFARGPIAQLSDDIVALQPTIIISVPRVLNRVVDSMKAKLALQWGPVRWLVERAIRHKAACAVEDRPHSLLCDLLTAKLRAGLGGRVRLIVNGGAPILAEVWEFLNGAVTTQVIQGYGLTEVCAGLAVQEMPTRFRNTVGPVSVAAEVKLRRVPGADYDPNGAVPSGELLVRGPTVFRGYYKQEELTAQEVRDGWFATGDVVKITESGHIQIIDRSKQLVKLSQGEYLSLTSLTDIYSRTPDVGFIYVYADPEYDQPLAVVIPTQAKIREWTERGISSIEDSDVVKRELVESLQKTHERNKLRGFERLTHIVVDTVEPTIENGMLTPSMKPQFQSLKRRYAEQLGRVYAQIAAERRARKPAE